MIKQIINYWITTYKENKFLFFLEMIGTLSSIIASLMISFMTLNSPMLLVFIFWLIGSILFTWACYIRKSPWMFFLMIFYSIMNTIGLINILIKLFFQ